MGGVNARARNLRSIDPAPQSLLDVEGMAARLGVTTRFVRRLVEERRVPFVKIGRFVRFDPVDVERWIDGARVEPTPSWSRSRGGGR